MGGFRIGANAETIEGAGTLGGVTLGVSARVIGRRGQKNAEALIAVAWREESAGRVHQYFIDIVEGRQSRGTNELDVGYDRTQFKELFPEALLNEKLAEKTSTERTRIIEQLRGLGRPNPVADAVIRMVDQQTWHWRPNVGGVDIGPWEVLETMLPVEGLQELVVSAPTKTFDPSAAQNPLQKMVIVAKEKRADFEMRADRARIAAKPEFRRAEIWYGFSWVGGFMALGFAADLGTRIYTGGRSLPQVLLSFWD